jgi:hypothetical protein
MVIALAEEQAQQTCQLKDLAANTQITVAIDDLGEVIVSMSRP